MMISLQSSFFSSESVSLTVRFFFFSFKPESFLCLHYFLTWMGFESVEMLESDIYEFKYSY